MQDWIYPLLKKSENKKLEETSLKRRMVQGVFWLGWTKVIGQAISWILTIYIARILSPDDYGLMGMALIFIGFIVLNNELGLGAAIVQKKDIREGDLSGIYWTIVLINIIFYLISFFLAPCLSIFFQEPRLTTVIRIIAIIFVINSFGLVSYSMLTRKLDFHKRSLAEFIGNLSGSISSLLFAVNGWGVLSLVFGNIILELIKTSMFIVFSPFKPKLSFSFGRMREMTSFGLKVFAVRAFSYVYGKTDTLIAGKMLGTTLLGYYSLSLSFASIPLDKLVSLATQVSFPAFSEIQEDKELLKKYFLNIVRVIAFVTFPIFLGIFLLADDAVPLFLTEKWSSAILPLKILCIASCFRAINAMNTPLLIAKGRPEIAIKSQVLFSILLPVGFLLGSLYGLEGLSYSWLLVFPVAFLIVTFWTLKVISASLIEYLGHLKHVFLGTAFMALCVLFFQQYVLFDLNRVIRFSGTCIMGALSYISYYALFHKKILNEVRGILKPHDRP